MYNAKAKEAGVYVLQSCGFDSIPAEMGVIHMQQMFEGGDVNDVESYLLIREGPEVREKCLIKDSMRIDMWIHIFVTICEGLKRV